MPRPSREIIHLLTAYLWATRSTCKRDNSKIGCVITTEDMKQVLSVGYNGPPQQLQNDACRNIVGNCNCIHAEANAITKVDGTIPNKIMFVTRQPCETCAGLICQSNINHVYYSEFYRRNEGINLLKKCGIETEYLELPDSIKLSYAPEHDGDLYIVRKSM